MPRLSFLTLGPPLVIRPQRLVYSQVPGHKKNGQLDTPHADHPAEALLAGASSQHGLQVPVRDRRGISRMTLLGDLHEEVRDALRTPAKIVVYFVRPHTAPGLGQAGADAFAAETTN